MSVPELKLRVDDFSWQGTCDADPRLFLRRLREPNDNVFTDILMGDLQPEIVIHLLAEFIRRTGPISSPIVEATSIAEASSPNEVVVKKYDKIVGVLKEAFRMNRIIVRDARLEPRPGKFDAWLTVG